MHEIASGENWYIYDIKRHPYNLMPADSLKLETNLNTAEGASSATTVTIDLVANGFKIRTTNSAAGEISFGTRTIAFKAYAKSPFIYSNAN